MNISELIIQASKSAQRCQRNWDLTKSIPEDIVEVFRQLVINAPTKQNEEFYSVIFLTDRNKIEEIYKYTDFDGQSKESNFEKNSQVLAPLVLIFCKETPSTYRKPETYEYEDKTLENDRLMSIGIISGQIVLSAAQLGLKTGFCGCFNPKEVSRIIDHPKPALLLGIGYPDATKTRVEHQFANKIYVSYDRPITITHIDDKAVNSSRHGVSNKETVEIRYSHNDFANNVEMWNRLFNLSESDLDQLQESLYTIYKETLVNPSNSKITQSNNCCSISWEGKDKESLELFKQRFISLPLIKKIHSDLLLQNWIID